MATILLVHWNADEAIERVERLAKIGFPSEVLDLTRGGEAARDYRTRPPTAIVIDLSRLPSHGRQVARYFRQTKATRHVPIVFADGEAEKVRRVREEFPDAAYTTWPRLGPALRRAIRTPVVDPVVPDLEAAYAHTPLVRKLGISPDSMVAVLSGPEGFVESLSATADGATFRKDVRAKADVVILFARSMAELTKRLAPAVEAIGPKGALWLAWPKLASKVKTDLTQAFVREAALAMGLMDNKVCALDATWSALRFSRRRSSKT